MEYYTSYLKSSNIYQNLKKSNELLDLYESKLKNLNNSLNDASGRYVENIISDINSLLLKFNTYENSIDKIINGLENNANKLDNVLIKYQNKIGKIINTVYKYDGTVVSENYKIAVPSGKSPIYERTTKNIESVGISNDGYILVKVKTVINKYQINIPNGHLHESGTISFVCRDNYLISSLTGYSFDKYDKNDQRISIGTINFTDLH